MLRDTLSRSVLLPFNARKDWTSPPNHDDAPTRRWVLSLPALAIVSPLVLWMVLDRAVHLPRWASTSLVLAFGVIAYGLIVSGHEWGFIVLWFAGGAGGMTLEIYREQILSRFRPS